jgi:hypothetical protein
MPTVWSDENGEAHKFEDRPGVSVPFIVDDVDHIEVRIAVLRTDAVDPDWLNAGNPSLRVQIKTGTKRSDIVRMLTKVLSRFAEMEAAAEEAHALNETVWEAMDELDGPVAIARRPLNFVRDGFKVMAWSLELMEEDVEEVLQELHNWNASR